MGGKQTLLVRPHMAAKTRRVLEAAGVKIYKAQYIGHKTGYLFVIPRWVDPHAVRHYASAPPRILDKVLLQREATTVVIGGQGFSVAPEYREQFIEQQTALIRRQEEKEAVKPVPIAELRRSEQLGESITTQPPENVTQRTAYYGGAIEFKEPMRVEAPGYQTTVYHPDTQTTTTFEGYYLPQAEVKPKTEEQRKWAKVEKEIEESKVMFTRPPLAGEPIEAGERDYYPMIEFGRGFGETAYFFPSAVIKGGELAVTKPELMPFALGGAVVSLFDVRTYTTYPHYTLGSFAATSVIFTGIGSRVGIRTPARRTLKIAQRQSFDIKRGTPKDLLSPKQVEQISKAWEKGTAEAQKLADEQAVKKIWTPEPVTRAKVTQPIAKTVKTGKTQQVLIDPKFDVTALEKSGEILGKNPFEGLDKIMGRRKAVRYETVIEYIYEAPRQKAIVTPISVQIQRAVPKQVIESKQITRTTTQRITKTTFETKTITKQLPVTRQIPIQTTLSEPVTQQATRQAIGQQTIQKTQLRPITTLTTRFRPMPGVPFGKFDVFPKKERVFADFKLKRELRYTPTLTGIEFKIPRKRKGKKIFTGLEIRGI